MAQRGRPASSAHQRAPAGGCCAGTQWAAFCCCTHLRLPRQLQKHSASSRCAATARTPIHGWREACRVAAHRRAGTSRAFATASLRKNIVASAPKSPPNSMPTTTSVHRLAPASSGHVSRQLRLVAAETAWPAVRSALHRRTSRVKARLKLCAEIGSSETGMRSVAWGTVLPGKGCVAQTPQGWDPGQSMALDR